MPSMSLWWYCNRGFRLYKCVRMFILITLHGLNITITIENLKGLLQQLFGALCNFVIKSKLTIYVGSYLFDLILTEHVPLEGIVETNTIYIIEQ